MCMRMRMRMRADEMMVRVRGEDVDEDEESLRMCLDLRLIMRGVVSEGATLSATPIRAGSQV